MKLKLKTRTKLPAALVGRTGIAVAKDGLTYNLDLDYSRFVQTGQFDPVNDIFAVWNKQTGLWNTINPAGLVAGSFYSAASASNIVPDGTSLAAIQRTSPSTTALTLPLLANQGGKALIIVDWSTSVTDHTITITPASGLGTTIMKAANWTIHSSANQPAAIILYPSIDLNGWYIAPLAWFDALSPTTTRGDIIFRNATTNTRLAAGTAGYLLQANGAGADPSYAGFLQTGTGAVTRAWQDKARDIFSVKDFGAVGDGSNDDTSAIQAAVNAAVANGAAPGAPTVFFPAGRYKITSTINQTALVPITLKGVGGLGSAIQLVATTGIAAFNIAPASALSTSLIVEDLYFPPPQGAGSTGLNNIAFNLNNANSPIFNRVRVIGYRNAILFTLSFGATIQNSVFIGTLDTALYYAADSSGNATRIVFNTFLDCGVTNSAPAIFIQGPSTNGVTLIGNDMEGEFLDIMMTGVDGGVIHGNYWDAGAGSSHIFFSGPVSNLDIRGNFHGQTSGSSNLSNLSNSYFGQNAIHNSTITFGSGGVNVDLGTNKFLGTGAIAGETGWNAPTLLNSWVNTGSPYANAGYRVHSDGTVELRGQISSGTNGSPAFTLPAGYFPVVGRRQVVSVNPVNGAIANVIIDTNGNVVPTVSSGTQVSLDGIRFTRQ